MANRYMVRVYDCSFVQDFVVAFDNFFDTLDEAKKYASDLMDDFGNDANYEYSAEVFIRTLSLGCFEPIGYYEFDYMGTDMDLFDLVSDMDDIDNLSNYSWHEMF